MDLKITPHTLCGEVTVPPSKSAAHRLIIAAALAEGTTRITNVSYSKDITATIEAMRALGADIRIQGDTVLVSGIVEPPESAVVDCCESGSTLRFLIPVACALGVKCTFLGRAKLPVRPITPYIEELPKHGVTLDFSAAKTGEFLPCTVSGKLTSGEFRIDGGISSQFITGLMLALPLLGGDSRITLTSRLESRPYVDITRSCIEQFGGSVVESDCGFEISGGQRLTAQNEISVEGDYSQAAFFYVANALSAQNNDGECVNIKGLNVNSFQGDKKIVEICEKIVYNNNGGLKPFDLDCSDIPDLVPVLAVLGTFCGGTSYIRGAARLRIKECDRLAAVSHDLNLLGARITEKPDGLVIEGVKSLHGGVVDGFTDHRIPMAMAIASTRCTEPVIITGAECVSKSYPDFFDVFKSLGGQAEEV